MQPDSTVITSVNCNHCGASLEAAADTRFVTCAYCGTQLEVCRTESSTFTQEIQAIAQSTDQIANDVAAIRLQNDLERIDREWSMRQAATPAPASGQGAGGAVGLAFAVFFASVCFIMAGFASSHGAPGVFALVPVGMGIFAIVAAIAAFAGQQGVDAARADYQRRRERLLRDIEQSRRSRQ